MNPAKEIIQQLVKICEKCGIEKVVISPGSRNAPIADAFINQSEIECYSIVDERSAGFFALGMAQQSRKTVALLCTSGTAVLNYAPAVAEAFYQKIPLLIITADRPQEMVNQGESQTINQRNIYANYVKAAFDLIQNPSNEDEVAYNIRLMSSAINETRLGNGGPIQLNFPLAEPLYEKLPVNGNEVRHIEVLKTTPTISSSSADRLASVVNTSKKTMVLVGSNYPDPALESLLKELSEKDNTIVLTETTGNLNHSNFIQNIDRVLATINETEHPQYSPDLLITISDQVISKKIKHFIRKNKPAQHWHIDPTQMHFDTYQCLTKTIPVKPFHFLEKILEKKTAVVSSDYRNLWHSKRDKAKKGHLEFLKNTSWSDLKVFQLVLEQIPDGTVLQMGNSSPVRYIQLFDQNPLFVYFSNRGTSGIEGCSSTAVGAANASDKNQLLITGELGFMYDNNALWNNYVDQRLKIIVINNQGGGIFRIIDGPDSVEEYEKYISTEHELKIEKLVRAHNLTYFSSNSEEELKKVLVDFINYQQAAVLEVFTPKTKNAVILKDYFKYLNNGTEN